ncbi:MAG: putative serine/threonine-protein kinase iks1 [Watsoniomyces obsoletus]|nr:MAG: putative serine/threonine-protein kinase iks1 [Watsoniomyces obsoletus]
MDTSTHKQGNDRLKEIESARNELEQKLKFLQKALKIWQTWGAEYEGLKEELENLDKGATKDEIRAVGRDFGGELVNEKEIQDLFYSSGNIQRTPGQIINLLSRRIEYVSKNVEAVEKHLRSVEERLESLLFDPNLEIKGKRMESTEIVEKLDDEGKVVAGTTSDSGKAASEVLKALDKAGIKESSNSQSSTSSGVGSRATTENSVDKKQDKSEEQTTKAIITSGGQKKEAISILSNENKPKSAKKSVRFSSDTKQGAPSISKKPKPSKKGMANKPTKRTIPAGKRNHKKVSSTTKNHATDKAPPSGTPNSKTKTSTPENKANSTMNATFNDNINLDSAVVPPSESSDEAVLRKEMLEYNMAEVGAVVAELNLAEDDDDEEDGDGLVDDDEEEEDDDDDDDEEDEFGRSTRRMINTKYRMEMEALQKKLAMREKERRMTLKNDSAVNKDTNQSNATSNESSAELKQRNPLADTIVEHAPISIRSQPTKKALHPSLLVASKTHSGLLSTSSAKRTAATKTSTNREETAGDDEDVEEEEKEEENGILVNGVEEALLFEQSLARERIRLRNRLIYRQGGFLEKTDEEKACVPLDYQHPFSSSTSDTPATATSTFGTAGNGGGDGNITANMNGHGDGNGHGNGHGDGSGKATPNANGHANANGNEDTKGDGNGNGDGDGNRMMLPKVPPKEKISRFKAARLRAS